MTRKHPNVLLLPACLLAFSCAQPGGSPGGEATAAPPPVGVPEAGATPPAAGPGSMDASPVQPAASPVTGTAAHGEMVHVILKDYEIQMPSTLPAGPTTLHVMNQGQHEHALEVEGQGIEKETPRLAPGEETRLDVTLQPGTYTVYCPVSDHASDKGMKVQLTVG